MTIHLPKEVESSLRKAVQNGQFASIDEAMTEAARLLLKKARRAKPSPPVKKPVTEAEFLKHLMDIGVVTQLPNPAEDIDDDDDPPIEIEGEPLSETIIRERR
jgi:Arc/MetJ-type ribon-helix-helix transcriptional regulator